MINPNLNTHSLKADYQQDQRLAIPEFMQDSIAERMHTACDKHIPYQLQYVLEGKYQSMNPAELAQLSVQEAERINNQISLAATQGIGFLYEGYLRSRAKQLPDTAEFKELNFLHSIFDYMGSTEVLNQIKQITGDQDINGVEPQYTRFTSGHFLTRHQDIVPGRNRRFAFVLSLSKNWHPDWGGLLQFYQKDGTPRDAWMPRFNVLSVFHVRHIHAVTYVTPYANAPRLSLTGWFTARDL